MKRASTPHQKKETKHRRITKTRFSCQQIFFNLTPRTCQWKLVTPAVRLASGVYEKQVCAPYQNNPPLDWSRCNDAYNLGHFGRINREAKVPFPQEGIIMPPLTSCASLEAWFSNSQAIGYASLNGESNGPPIHYGPIQQEPENIRLAILWDRLLKMFPNPFPKPVHLYRNPLVPSLFPAFDPVYRFAIAIPTLENIQFIEENHPLADKGILQFILERVWEVLFVEFIESSVHPQWSKIQIAHQRYGDFCKPDTLALRRKYLKRNGESPWLCSKTLKRTKITS